MRHEFDPFTEKETVEYYEEPAREIPVLDRVDVLVVGGSQSGVTAAISAARHGSDVKLVERFGFLGGQSIYSMVVQWEKRAFINNLGAILTKGLPKEILDKILEKGDSDRLWDTSPGCPEMRDGEEWLNPEAIKATLVEMCEEEGIDTLLHTKAVDTIVERQDELPKTTGVVFENKTGRFAIKADVIIDATADLDLVWDSIGEDGCKLRDPRERMHSGFYVWYGGVDNEKFIDWYVEESAAEGYPDPRKYPDKVLRHVRENKLIKIYGLPEIVAEAEEKGLMEKIDDIFSEVGREENIDLGMKWVGHDRWAVAFGIGVNMLDAWELSKFESLRLKLVHYMIPILKLIPGWDDVHVSRDSVYIGSRETRVLKAEKVIDESVIGDPDNKDKPTPPDAIGRSGAHDPGKNRVDAGYPIPYGSLVPENLDGVVVCGRAVGTEFDQALNAHRGIVPSMVTGQGAGTAAALANQEGVELRDVDTSKLQEVLREDGVQLDHETYEFDFEIPEVD